MCIVPQGVYVICVVAGAWLCTSKPIIRSSHVVGDSNVQYVVKLLQRIQLAWLSL